MQIPHTPPIIYDDEDADGDRVKDWFEYRMFGDLSKSPSMIPMGMDFPTSGRVSLGRMPDC